MILNYVSHKSIWMLGNKFSSNRVIDIWNSIPASLLHCNTIETFKKKLNCLLKA